MKSQIELICINSQRDKFSDEIVEFYLKKISHFCHFKLTRVKPYSAGRGSQEYTKVKNESKQLIEKINPSSFVILCDQKGQEFTNHQLAYFIEKEISFHKSLTFIIGGAYGVSKDLEQKSQVRLKLSSLVLNHHVAQVVLLEQIYRTFTIINGLPYHNG